MSDINVLIEEAKAERDHWRATAELTTKGAFDAIEVMAKENAHLRKRNEKMAELLDAARHNRGFESQDGSRKCFSDCPICAWEKMKKEMKP